MVSLKGYTKPIQAWEVTQSSTIASRYRARLQGEPLPFVGREGELDILVRSWGKARAGRGQVVEIIGEPGIGKSRLIETLEQRLAGDRPIRVRWFCSPQHGDSAFYPVIEQLERAASIKRQDPATARFDKLRRLIGQSDESDGTNLAAFTALLSIPLDLPSVLDTLTPEKRKEVTMAALLALTFRKAARRPKQSLIGKRRANVLPRVQRTRTQPCITVLRSISSESRTRVPRGQDANCPSSFRWRSA
jgi:hypothetical protein